jgi:hypothetical protein
MQCASQTLREQFVTLPSISTFGAVILLAASAVLLFSSGLVLSELRIARRISMLFELAWALLAPQLLFEMGLARLRGRPTRLVRKRYRSLLKRAWRRCVDRFFAAEEAVPVSLQKVGLALMFAFAGAAVILLSFSPNEAVAARL